MLANPVTVFVFKLARIQTDSVAEKLRDLHPDVHFEIGKSTTWETISCLHS